jgi:AraC-like DNA-binding protein
MSPDGPSVGVDLPAGLVIELERGGGFDQHSYSKHQLAATASGVLVLVVNGRSWVLLPRTRGLWIPARVPHAVEASGPATMLSAYVDPRQCPLGWSSPTVFDASGLAGELIERLARADLPAEQRERTEAVMWDVMRPLAVATLSPPLPVDDRARRVGDSLLADVTDSRALAAWGRTIGASARTLARLFVAEAGLGFERWRTRSRLAAALPLLADGAAVSATAHAVGYASPSAFVAAFRREVGVTPAEYFQHP